MLRIGSEISNERDAMAMLNYRHLHYFWIVARSGGVVRAAERLHVTPQTVSGQIRLFEEDVGETLFTRSGRGLQLTDAGRTILSYAEDVFAAGEALEAALEAGMNGGAVLFRVGISDAVPKSVAYRMLEPALRDGPRLRMTCREGKLAELVTDMAAHRLDIVLADAPMPAELPVRGFSHLLGHSGVTFFAAAGLANCGRIPFPRCLDAAPMLLPGENAAIRPKLLRWFQDQKLHPRIAGEFDDSALMKAFGQRGAGVFPAPTAIAAEIEQQYRVRVLGSTDNVKSEFYAISVERRVTHPTVQVILRKARDELFSGRA